MKKVHPSCTVEGESGVVESSGEATLAQLSQAVHKDERERTSVIIKSFDVVDGSSLDLGNNTAANSTTSSAPAKEATSSAAEKGKVHPNENIMKNFISPDASPQIMITTFASRKDRRSSYSNLNITESPNIDPRSTTKDTRPPKNKADIIGKVIVDDLAGAEMYDTFTEDEAWVPISDAAKLLVENASSAASGSEDRVRTLSGSTRVNSRHSSFARLSRSSLESNRGMLRLPDGSMYFDEVFRKGSATANAGSTTSLASRYSHPVSASQASNMLPPGGHGLMWHAMVIADSDRSFQIQARRPVSQVRNSDFFSSLVKTDDNRWIFTGVLNGWPGLRCLELLEITCKHHWLSLSVFGHYLTRSRVNAKSVWNSATDGDTQPVYPEGETGVRLSLRAPPWSSMGWSADSPGFVWWFSPQRPPQKRFCFGQRSVQSIRKFYAERGLNVPKAVMVHYMGHRFAKGKGRWETAKDKLIYHGLNVIEWDHGAYVTVVELAALNGHQRNRALFHEDRDAEVPELIKYMHPNMITPWRMEFSEFRVSDLPGVRNFAMFQEYVKKYTGNEHRFIDPCYMASMKVRLQRCDEADLAQYLVNYMRRDTRYHLEHRNCQSAAADLAGFLAGKGDIRPLSAIARGTYHSRTHLFLYNPEEYTPIMPKGYSSST